MQKKNTFPSSFAKNVPQRNINNSNYSFPFSWLFAIITSHRVGNGHLRPRDILGRPPSTVPLAPIIIPEDCSAENNSVTVAWQPPSHSFVQGYVLELDDGSGGEFRVSVSKYT